MPISTVKMFQRGRCILSSILIRWDVKKHAIYRAIWLVDTGESVAEKELQGRSRKLTKAQEKKGTY